MRRLKRRAQQRQVPNRPHKLRYNRSCTKYVHSQYGCLNCGFNAYQHLFPKASS